MYIYKKKKMNTLQAYAIAYVMLFIKTIKRSNSKIVIVDSNIYNSKPIMLLILISSGKLFTYLE